MDSINSLVWEYHSPSTFWQMFLKCFLLSLIPSYDIDLISKIIPSSPKKKAKPKPKPVIEYPPVPTKKWIPPDQRKKPSPPKPAYEKPPGISQKLPISTLEKVWHHFKIKGDDVIITGTHSQNDKRFRPKSRGYQGASNCLVCCAFIKLYPMPTWTSNIVDKILELGERLYVKSLMHSDSKCEVFIDVNDVYNSFFLEDSRITMSVGSQTVSDKLSVDKDMNNTLKLGLDRFFTSNTSGIFVCQTTWAAIWKDQTAYYLFEPNDHNADGKKWTGLKGEGMAVVMRCKTKTKMAKVLLSHLSIVVSSKYVIYPCQILRMVKINRSPPAEVPEMSEEEKKRLELRQERLKQILAEKKAKVVAPPPPPAVPEETLIQVEEISPDIPETAFISKKPSWLKDAVLTRRDIPKCKIPAEKPRKESVSFFVEISPKVGILRGSTHQDSEQFAKFQGRQTIANAVAALAMLRVIKARRWVRQVVDEILNLGNLLVKETLKVVGMQQKVNLANLTKKIPIEDKVFTHDIEEMSVFGKIQTRETDILDINQGLTEFLKDNDCCIILAPLTLAVWVENGMYYMFDPHERDQTGKKIVVPKIFKGSKSMLPASMTTGVACVTWFRTLKELCALYINNLEKQDKEAHYQLCRVKINDYIDVPDPWYNFTGLSREKWILRGTFNQNNTRFSRQSRNTQCTANATMALVYSKMKPEQDWSSETVDQVLISGDELYCNTVKCLKENNKFHHPMLMVDEVNRKFPLENKEVNLQVDDCLVNGIVGARESTDILNLRKGFEEFFKDNESGVVTSHNISVAVWKKDEVYYYYDSHSRDEKGIVTSYGTACLLRILNLEELARSVETNLGATRDTMYNISRIIINLLEKIEGGVVKPPLNYFYALDPMRAILCSTLSEMSAKYGLNRSKQTVPMCLMALGFNKLVPSGSWSIEQIDKILDMGNDYYTKVIEALYDEGYFEKDADVAEEVEGPTSANPSAGVPSGPGSIGGAVPDGGVGGEENGDSDAVTSVNVKKKFKIGVNAIEFELELISEGLVEHELGETLKGYYGVEEPAADDFDPKPPGVHNEPTVPPEQSELLFETDIITVSIWRDDKVFYLFDPKPRDYQGQVIGKEDWSAKVEPKVFEEEWMDNVEEDDEIAKPDDDPLTGGDDDDLEKGGAGDMKIGLPSASSSPIYLPKPEQLAAGEPEYGAEEGNQLEGDEGENQIGEVEKKDEIVPVKEKHSVGYWKALENEGSACCMWFISLFDLINHIVENTPPNKREEMTYRLNKVILTNKPELKETYDPQCGERKDAFDGDWYNFKEIEHCKWILQGKKNLDDPMYPELNRNKQATPCCLAALAFAQVYSMTAYKESTVDEIMKYGDRLYTYVIRDRRKALKNNPDLGLTDQEIDMIMESATFELPEFITKICVSEHMVSFTLDQEYLIGHTQAKDSDDNVLNVKKALNKFFEKDKFGLLECKDLIVAIWRGEKMHYMYDPNRRAPNGTVSPTGVPCITRFLSIDHLANTFNKNVPRDKGKSAFVVHRITMETKSCPRERQPPPEEVVKKEPVKPEKEITTFKTIIPGKTIVRGSISQESKMFDRGPNVQSPAIAFIALTMSLIHKPKTWSKPIIDEIIMVGDQLYLDSIDALGFDFNPWEDRLDIYKVKCDYKIGVVKANCELRNKEQMGIVDIKTLKGGINLRQGIERFFEENTHGILLLPHATYAIWEEENGDERLIYMFDPNPRGPTGLPMTDGKACVLTFVNAKIAFDHILSITSDALAVYKIVPVEIVVGTQKVGKKAKKRPKTESLSVTKTSTAPTKLPAAPTKTSTAPTKLPAAPTKLPAAPTKLATAPTKLATASTKTITASTAAATSKLPKCSRTAALAEQSKIRKIAEQQRQHKKELQLSQLGRKEYFHLSGGEAILRGMRSLNSTKFSTQSRNNQDIPVNVISILMFKYYDITKWTCDDIENILRIGDQIYIDSYVMYKPTDPKLGVENIVRKFMFYKNIIHLYIYKPLEFPKFTSYALQQAMTSLFYRRNCSMIRYKDLWISVFIKDGLYYLFDPHDRDYNGKKVTPGSAKPEPTAVVLRFESLEAMCNRIVENLTSSPEDSETPFAIVLVGVHEQVGKEMIKK